MTDKNVHRLNVRQAHTHTQAHSLNTPMSDAHLIIKKLLHKAEAKIFSKKNAEYPLTNHRQGDIIEVNRKWQCDYTTLHNILYHKQADNSSRIIHKCFVIIKRVFVHLQQEIER